MIDNAATVEIAQRGQVTIPKSIRQRHKIEAGQKYGIQSMENGIIVLTPHPGKTDEALEKLRNELLNKGASLEEMLADLRRIRETDE